MSFYENVCCPVCNKEFVEGDDIVTCPECGTPHHRECYDIIGRCVNHGLHKAGYSFYDEQMDIVGTSKAQFDSKEQEIELENSLPNPIFDFSDGKTNYDKLNDTIEGESIGDVAATVRTNIGYFVKTFKDMEGKNKKFTWNWAAFIFGPFYLLFRKMYKQGAAFFALGLTFIYGSNAAILKFAPEFTQALKDMATTFAQDSVSAFNSDQMANIMQIKDFAVASKISYITIAIFIVMHFIIGIITNYIYKRDIITIIKKVSEQLSNGATFTQATIISPDANMTQEQMKKMYLSHRGGTSFFAPAIALLVLSFIL